MAADWEQLKLDELSIKDAPASKCVELRGFVLELMCLCIRDKAQPTNSGLHASCSCITGPSISRSRCSQSRRRHSSRVQP